MPDAIPRGSDTVRRPAAAIKVPARITVLFWVIKLVTTGTGEATSDYLGTVPLVLAGAVAVGGFAAALWWQLRSPSYRPAVYWLAVTMVAVSGTAAADGVHVALGVPYIVSTLFWAGALAGVLVWWQRSEGSLSIHSITTARRECFYWATVLATFALGTAVGDLTATTFALGYLGSAILFAALFAIPAIGYRLGLPATLAFWIAYILTRPLGASIADWLAVPHARGGLDIGHLPITAVGVLLIAAAVVAVQVRARRDALWEHS